MLCVPSLPSAQLLGGSVDQYQGMKLGERTLNNLYRESVAVQQWEGTRLISSAAVLKSYYDDIDVTRPDAIMTTSRAKTRNEQRCLHALERSIWPAADGQIRRAPGCQKPGGTADLASSEQLRIL